MRSEISWEMSSKTNIRVPEHVKEITTYFYSKIINLNKTAEKVMILFIVIMEIPKFIFVTRNW